MAKLIWRNLLRSKRRVLLTLASITTTVFLICFLSAFLAAMKRAEGAQDSRVVVRNAISLTFRLPEAYWEKLRQLEHVEVVVPLTFFGGIYKDQRRENVFTQFSCDPESMHAAFPEYLLGDGEMAAWAGERAAFIAGKALADRHGWKIGDPIVLQGTYFPTDLTLTLRGIYTVPASPIEERKIYFHRRYLEESLGNPGVVGGYWLRVDSPANVGGVIRAAEALFDNSGIRAKAETEKAFKLSFLDLIGNVRLLVGAISLAMLVSILFINANTMAMAVRERLPEVAVLKTLGFPPGRLLRLLVGESLALFLAGAALGVGVAALLVRAIDAGVQEVVFMFGTLRLTPGVVLAAFSVAATVGVLSSLPAAATALRLDIADTLRRVG